MKITVRGVEMAYDEQGEGLPVVFTNGDSPHTVAGDSPPRVWGRSPILGGRRRATTAAFPDRPSSPAVPSFPKKGDFPVALRGLSPSGSEGLSPAAELTWVGHSCGGRSRVRSDARARPCRAGPGATAGAKGWNMARRPRGFTVNSFLHITGKGNRGVPIFIEQPDYEGFLDQLRDFAVECGVRVHAYCLMANHFHLLVEVGEVPVSKLMHRLLFRHARYVNRRYGFRGHLFGDRFWSKLCPYDAYLLELLRYIHLNPVRAGLTEVPESYRWSSHRIYLGLANVPWVSTAMLDLFGGGSHEGAEAFARFVLGGMPEPSRAGPSRRPTSFGPSMHDRGAAPG